LLSEIAPGLKRAALSVPRVEKFILQDKMTDSSSLKNYSTPGSAGADIGRILE
jgi:hypothetical protein